MKPPFSYGFLLGSDLVQVCPVRDDDAVVKAQRQGDRRIVHQHHPFHGSAQLPQILNTTRNR